MRWFAFILKSLLPFKNDAFANDSAFSYHVVIDCSFVLVKPELKEKLVYYQ